MSESIFAAIDLLATTRLDLLRVTRAHVDDPQVDQQRAAIDIGLRRLARIEALLRAASEGAEGGCPDPRREHPRVLPQIITADPEPRPSLRHRSCDGALWSDVL